MNDPTLNRALQAVRDIAVQYGLSHVTRRRIAQEIGVSAVHISRIGTRSGSAGSRGAAALIRLARERAEAAGDTAFLDRVQEYAQTGGDGSSAVHRLFSGTKRPCGVADGETVRRVAYDLVRKHGFAATSRSKIAIEASVGEGTVGNVFGGMARMPGVLLERAISLRDAMMIARGLQIDHPVARSAPLELRQAAAALLAG